MTKKEFFYGRMPSFNNKKNKKLDKAVVVMDIVMMLVCFTLAVLKYAGIL